MIKKKRTHRIRNLKRNAKASPDLSPKGSTKKNIKSQKINPKVVLQKKKKNLEKAVLAAKKTATGIKKIKAITIKAVATKKNLVIPKK